MLEQKNKYQKKERGVKNNNNEISVVSKGQIIKQSVMSSTTVQFSTYLVLLNDRTHVDPLMHRTPRNVLVLHSVHLSPNWTFVLVVVLVRYN